MDNYPVSILPKTYSVGSDHYVNFTQYKNLREQARKLKEKSVFITFSYRNINTIKKDQILDFYNDHSGKYKRFNFVDFATGNTYICRFDNEVVFSLQAYDRWSSGTIVLRIVEALSPLVGEYRVNLYVRPGKITFLANPAGAGFYDNGATVNIEVSAVQGYEFEGWSGEQQDVDLLDDKNALITSLAMPTRNVNYTANYVSAGPPWHVVLQVDPFELTQDAAVEGAGTYDPGSKVNISTGFVEHYYLSEWQGKAEDMALLDDNESLSTFFYMPERHVTLTAKYLEQIYY